MPIYEYAALPVDINLNKLQSMGAEALTALDAVNRRQRAISLFSAVTAGNDGELSSVAGMGGCPSCAGGGCACSID